VAGLLDGSRWIAAAEEFPPQKLRRDYRAGLANSGILLMAGAPVVGSGVLRAMEEWIWPANGNPTWMFKWPFEQNALTQCVFLKYPDRYTLFKPGCPFNSPFGAMFRHMVGGTPHRAIYHPEHRPPWFNQALQCTLEAVHIADAANLPPVRCTPNEPSLHLDGTGCDEMEILQNSRPTGGKVFARLRAADWESCCAFCNAASSQCVAWSFVWNWPYSIISCMLFSSLQGMETAAGRVAAYKKSSPMRTVRAFAVPASSFAPNVKHRANITLVKLAWEADTGSSLDDASDEFFTDLDAPPRKATAFSTADEETLRAHSSR